VVSEILADGFELSSGNRIANLALLSLRSSLRSYFSTYGSMRRAFPWITESDDHSREDRFHSVNYSESAAEAVIHFQHFVELVCKDYLQDRHLLLVTDLSQDDISLDKLLAGEQVSNQQVSRGRFLEFSTVLRRICALLKEDRMPSEIDFISKEKSWLEAVNGYRNRLWHSGTFIIRYGALDRLFVSYVLPFVEKVVALERFSGLDDIWKYRPLACGIDPISALATESTSSPDLGRIALFKELARAAYENPLRGGAWAGFLDDHYRGPAIAAAVGEELRSNVASIKDCPVCGSHTLVLYDDIDYDD
jgi:hypothetical protein